MLAFLYIIAMTMIAFSIVPLCLEYTWTFYIMLIVSMLAIQLEKKGDSKLNKLFLITGMVTCFFDFLTTEIITLFVPMLFVLIIRKKENRLQSFKQGIYFVVKMGLLWSAGYVGMWIVKWGLASICLGINAMEYVTDEAMNRVNGLQGLTSAKEMYLGAITRNWHTLYPINCIKRVSDLWNIPIGFAIILIILIDWKRIRKMWFPALLSMIAIMPYIRYLILANHSYRHSMFTFRSQIITIIAIGWLIVEMLNYDRFFKIFSKFASKKET